MILKQHWDEILEEANIATSSVSDRLWKEIESAHSTSGRHYHNLQHLEELFDHYQALKSSFVDPTIVAFTIFYHDIIYNRLMPANNEKRSAELAAQRLPELGLSPERVQAIYELILDTKEHEILHAKEVPDAALFLDMDLAILATPKERYAIYIKQIRREYGHIPTRFFNKARLTVLQSIYQQEYIYKTDFFRQKYEEQARRNLELEIAFLSRRD